MVHARSWRGYSSTSTRSEPESEARRSAAGDDEGAQIRSRDIPVARQAGPPQVPNLIAALGREEEARESFELSANEAGDFSDMAVTAHSPLSYFRGLSLRELGRGDDARTIFADLKAFAETKLKETAKIDDFATSLPNLLVFDEDLQARRDAENHLLLALAHHGLGETTAARSALAKTLAFTCADQRATDLQREFETA